MFSDPEQITLEREPGGKEGQARGHVEEEQLDPRSDNVRVLSVLETRGGRQPIVGWGRGGEWGGTGGGGEGSSWRDVWTFERSHHGVLDRISAWSDHRELSPARVKATVYRGTGVEAGRPTGRHYSGPGQRWPWLAQGTSSRIG